MSYARRVDNNHAAIANALRSLGAFVKDTSDIGGGLPDMWVSSSYWTGWLEIKNPERSASRRKPQPNQQAFIDMANKNGKHAHVVLTVEEAIRLVFDGRVAV